MCVTGAQKIFTVYCLGDSWTTGFGVNPAECWVRLVAEQTGFKMINAGLNGDIVSGMLRRFRHTTELVPDSANATDAATRVVSVNDMVRARAMSVVSVLGTSNKASTLIDDGENNAVKAVSEQVARRKNFDVLFFLGGGNDILNECRDDHARANVIAILDYARDLGIPIMLATVFPFVPDVAERLWVHGKDYNAINEVMENYAGWLRKTAIERGLPYADLWKLIAGLGQDRRHEISLDGIHVTSEGHRILADFIAEQLKALAAKMNTSEFRTLRNSPPSADIRV